MKILIVDDDEYVRTLLSRILANSAHAIDTATEGEAGLNLATAYPYDLIILDLSLPQLDGIDLCRQLRTRGDRTPILLLAEQDTSAKIAVALDAGADDCMIKPFDLVELMARVRALLRRKDLSLTPIELTWGNLCLNPVAAEVTYQGNLLSLTPKEYSLLELLLQNPQRVFSRSAILDRIWSSDMVPIEGTVTNHVKDLRQKLKAAGMTVDLIETVYGLGYRLKAPPLPATADSQVDSQPDLQQVLQPHQSALGETATVMVVDNDRAMLEGLNYLLLPWGLRIVCLNQPEQFWQMLPSIAPNLLILNLEMLTFNSVELCQQVRQDAVWSDLPILAMTSHSDTESVQRLFAIGVDDFVNKPIVGPELVTRVISRLERVRFQQQTLPVNAGRAPTAMPTRSSLRKAAPNAAEVQASSDLSDLLDLQVAQSRSAQVIGSAANLLLIDDQPNNLRVLSAILDGQGYKVRKAVSGEIALEAIDSQLPDLILLDIKMPGMNGYEVCANLKANEKTRSIPVIFLSALDDTTDKIKAFTVGGADYITKPFQAEEVLARIKHQLIIQQQQRQLAERNRQLQHMREILREEEAQFQDAFARLTIGVGFVGLDNTWLKVNPALCQMLGYAESELLATPVASLLQSADRLKWQQGLQQMLDQPINNALSQLQIEMCYCCKADRSLRGLTHISIVRHASGEPLYGLVQVQAIENFE